jgi:hypothetical protein
MVGSRAPPTGRKLSKISPSNSTSSSTVLLHHFLRKGSLNMSSTVLLHHFFSTVLLHHFLKERFYSTCTNQRTSTTKANPAHKNLIELLGDRGKEFHTHLSWWSGRWWWRHEESTRKRNLGAMTEPINGYWKGGGEEEEGACEEKGGGSSSGGGIEAL